MNDDPAQRPGAGVRLFLLLATVFGFLAVFSIGFPPAAPDRLPLLVLSLLLALLAAWSPQRGLTSFAFLFPLAGAGDRLFGGADAMAWPVLLFAGFAAGWTFRFLYDFESVAESTRFDPILRTLVAVWTLSAFLAVVSARTLWASSRGLSLRAVNGQGLLDAAAIRDSVLCLAVLASGVGFFFLLRRAGEAARARALSAALAGVGASAALAIAQRFGLAPAETSEFWRSTGRLSGGAVDPNALGLLCGLASVAAVARLAAGSGRRARAAVLAALCAAGLVLSGSRSGLLVAGLGLLLLVAAGGPARRRLALLVGAVAAVAVIAALALRGSPGTTGSRVSQLLDPSLPTEFRTSARPLLWASALRLFRRHPVEGAGLSAFSWQLPDLAAEAGHSLPIRDNPGSAYLQALAETGLIGFALLAALVVALGRLALSGRDGAGGAVAAFLVALAVGSHWLAPDVALLFFLLAAVAAPIEVPRASGRRLRAALVLIYAGAAFAASLSTLREDVAFRYRQGIGFHEKEVGRGGPFYWTQRRFAIFLPPGKAMLLSLAHFTPEGRPVELTAESGGRRVYARTLVPGQSVSLRLNASANEARVVRFAVSRAFVPKRLGLSSDRRELGLVAVFPAGR
jgi:O-antigen ligase